MQIKREYVMSLMCPSFDLWLNESWYIKKKSFKTRSGQ